MLGFELKINMKYDFNGMQAVYAIIKLVRFTKIIIIEELGFDDLKVNLYLMKQLNIALVY